MIDPQEERKVMIEKRDNRREGRKLKIGRERCV